MILPDCESTAALRRQAMPNSSATIEMFGGTMPPAGAPGIAAIDGVASAALLLLDIDEGTVLC